MIHRLIAALACAMLVFTASPAAAHAQQKQVNAEGWELVNGQLVENGVGSGEWLLWCQPGSGTCARTSKFAPILYEHECGTGSCPVVTICVRGFVSEFGQTQGTLRLWFVHAVTGATSSLYFTWVDNGGSYETKCVSSIVSDGMSGWVYVKGYANAPVFVRWVKITHP